MTAPEVLALLEGADFATALQRLYSAGYRGSLVLHFDAGVPRRLAILEEHQLPLFTKPVKRGLTKGSGVAHAVRDIG